MGEKIKNMFRGHKEKKKNQNGGFSYMLASFIIHKRGWIESVFVIGCLLSLLTMNFVNVNYDLTKYLPETAESAIGLDVMRDKFGYPGTARVMVKDVSLYEAKQYKDEIADTKTGMRSTISHLWRRVIPPEPPLPSTRSRIS